jgi:hypothetical protein
VHATICCVPCTQLHRAYCSTSHRTYFSILHAIAYLHFARARSCFTDCPLHSFLSCIVHLHTRPTSTAHINRCSGSICDLDKCCSVNAECQAYKGCASGTTQVCCFFWFFVFCALCFVFCYAIFEGMPRLLARFVHIIYRPRRVWHRHKVVSLCAYITRSIDASFHVPPAILRPTQLYTTHLKIMHKHTSLPPANWHRLLRQSLRPGDLLLQAAAGPVSLQGVQRLHLPARVHVL